MWALVLLAGAAWRYDAYRRQTAVSQANQDLDAINRLMDRIARTWPTKPVDPVDADRLEAYMQPGQPVSTRARAMRAGQVIGQERFRKILMAGFSDPDPRIRRTAVGKADVDLGLWPSMVPSLEHDPDAQVRAAWSSWMQTVEFRVRERRDPSTGTPVTPPSPYR